MARYVHPQCDRVQLHVLEGFERSLLPKGRAQESVDGGVKAAVGGGVSFDVDLTGLLAVYVGIDTTATVGCQSRTWMRACMLNPGTIWVGV